MGKIATIVQSSGKSVELKESPGLFSCLLEHAVKETSATFEWSGPKIKEEDWEEMMAFFQWTYDTEKTEAQVRLFVHPELGWKIWAFPQDSASAMTTKEVPNEESRTQRAAIGEGYIPFGTVHHHCSSPAFQSGVDTSDEDSVDGLHITIGKMADTQHDMHARLYIKGNKFDVNMSAFWDIGDEGRAKLERAKEFDLPIDLMADKIARSQMCSKCSDESEFPDVWVTNYMPHKPGISKTMIPGSSWCTHCQGYPLDKHASYECPNRPKSLALPPYQSHSSQGHQPNGSSQGSRKYWSPEHVYDELRTQGVIMGLENDEMDAIIEEVTCPTNIQFYQKLMDLLSDNFMSFKELETVHDKQKEIRVKKEEEAEAAELDKQIKLEEKIKEMTPSQREAFEASEEYRAWCGYTGE